jgi:hypothetical protein
MLELNTIGEFSRYHCIGICAVLIPTSLCLSSATLLGVAMNKSLQLIRVAIYLGILTAILLLLHVATWLSIGVVMLPTFILPVIAILTLSIQIYALINPQQLRNLSLTIVKIVGTKYQQFTTKSIDFDRAIPTSTDLK